MSDIQSIIQSIWIIYIPVITNLELYSDKLSIRLIYDV